MPFAISALFSAFVGIYLKIRFAKFILALMLADAIYIIVNNLNKWIIDKMLSYINFSDLPELAVYIISNSGFIPALNLFISLVLTFKSFQIVIKAFIRFA